MDTRQCGLSRIDFAKVKITTQSGYELVSALQYRDNSNTKTKHTREQNPAKPTAEMSIYGEENFFTSMLTDLVNYAKLIV